MHIKKALLKSDRRQGRIDHDIPPKIDQNVKRGKGLSESSMKE